MNLSLAREFYVDGTIQTAGACRRDKLYQYSPLRQPQYLVLWR